MVKILLHMYALPGSQADLRAGGDRIGPAVGVDGHIGDIVDFLVGKAVVHPDQAVAAAPVDDVLCLEPVEMVGGVLSLLEIQQLFRIDLGILVGQAAVAVAERDEGKPQLVKIAHAVVGNVPAQHAVPDFIVLVPDILPLLGRKMAEGGEVAAIFLAHALHLFQSLVDLRTFHRNRPLPVFQNSRLLICRVVEIPAPIMLDETPQCK